MKAAVFADVGTLSVGDVAVPEIEHDSDVLVRVAACGICGTDLHILDDPPGHPGTVGIVLGHEFVGDVEGVGSAVDSVAVGDRVAVRPIVTCGACGHCLAGAPNHCSRSTAMGVFRDGGLAEYVVVPQTACIPISPDVPATVAALTEPLACVVNAIQGASPRSSDDVVVIGGGPIGLLFTAALRAAGVHRIVVIEPSERRRSVAARIGADGVVDPTHGDVSSATVAVLGRHPDLIIDAVGSQLGTAVELAGRRARIVLFGMNAHARPAVSQYAITEKELSILGSYVGQHSFPDAIALLESGRLDLEPIVSHVVGLDALPDAIEAARKGEVVKVVCTPR